MKVIRTILLVLALLVALGVVVYSGLEITGILGERHESNVMNEELRDKAVTKVTPEQPKDAQNTSKEEREDSAGAAEETVPSETAPIQVDFEYLTGVNEDVAGWIYCEDTPINLPILQSEDNSYYLHRLVDGTYNIAGSLFLDFRNQFDFSDWNSIIYGHNMKNGSMLACLNEYKKQEYYEEHPVMYLLTPEKQYKVELVAGILGKSDGSFYDFPVPEERREEVIQGWLEASTFKTNVEILPEDRFVTLSTCTYEFRNARYVVIGVLREIGN